MPPLFSDASDDGLPQLSRYALIAAAAWLAVVASSWAWNLRQLDEATLHDTVSRMTSSIERTLLQTRWDQRHPEIPVTFFRHDFQDDALLRERFGNPIGSGLVVRARLTSLSPSGAQTSPDAWEKAALEKIRGGDSEVTAVVSLGGTPHLRMLRKVPIGQDCRACHSSPQAQAGGGLSVSIPMGVLSLMQRRRMVLLAESHVILALLGLVLVGLGHRGLRRSEMRRLEATWQREKTLLELQTALAEIRTLNGIIPICASCKKIRDDKGFWSQVEAYVQKHSQASFSHGICPDCSHKLYPDYTE